MKKLAPNNILISKKIAKVTSQTKSYLFINTSRFYRRFRHLPIYFQAISVVILLVLISTLALQLRYHQLYYVSDASRQLLSKSSVETSLIKVSGKAVSYDASSVKPTLKKDVTIAAPTDATGKTGYQATIDTDFQKGLTFGDSNSELSFQMTPLFDANDGQYSDGQIIFPVSTSIKIFQTFKKNGIKEDIVLSSAPGKTATWQWRLGLGDKLTAKLLPDGSVGIYAASPYLYGNIQINDAKTQALIDKARTTDKNYLVFAIPAPFIKDAVGRILQEDVSFRLSGDTLTLEARNLINKQYPISIDPSVVITTTADFATNYSDDGTINYSAANQISRSAVGLGTVGATTVQAAAFTTARDAHTSVAYNGYLYVIGGVVTTANALGCNAAGWCNDIQYCPINSNGSIGTCVQQLAAFTTPRYYHASVAYNGYLYIIGGAKNSGAEVGCMANGLCNDIQYCPINANGSVGTCVQQLTAFTSARAYLASVVYNGYLYVIGGGASASATGCIASGNCNDIQYCPIKADGSVGTCVQQLTAFTTPRVYLTSVVYNGYLYVIGGSAAVNAAGCNASGYCNDIQYCPIKADGSVGTCVQQLAAFTTPRYIHSSVAYNGYLYVIGGYGGSYQNDIQHCPINADGSVGVCVQKLAAFTTARTAHTSIAYNGYLYVIGGWNGTIVLNDIQYLPITTGTPAGVGTVGNTTRQVGAFTTQRYGHTSVAYNGYLYVIGGTNGTNQNDIQYCPINTNGSVGTCVVQAAAFTTARYGHASVAYNGYLYVIGGTNGTVYYDDIQYCPINTNGSVGTCVVQATAFTTARAYHTSVAYNGYLYVIGGSYGTHQNDIQYCPINTNGSVGTCVVQAAAFTTARYGHASAAYNGYLYILGGYSGSAYQNDIQYCPINSNGSIGTCVVQAAAFTSARQYATSVVYNGYLYIVGGRNATVNFDDIQNCPINSNGSVGTCVQQLVAFTNARSLHASVTYNGYLYVIGGAASASDTSCNASGYCNDIQYIMMGSRLGAVGATTQQAAALGSGTSLIMSVAYNGYLYTTGGSYSTSVRRCPINADGSIGACTDQPSALNRGAGYHGVAVHNGYLYVVGGYNGTSYTNEIEHCPINPTDGSVGTCVTQNSLNTIWGRGEAVIYNGYLYIVGGTNGTVNLRDIEYCPINTDGSVGICVTQTNALVTAHGDNNVAAYNGYLYSIGGNSTDIEHCPINTDGSVGICVKQSSAFTTARYWNGVATYNGYLYIVGGAAAASATGCDSSGRCNDIQHCPINADGSIGTCDQQLTAFTNARYNFGTAVYNGYLYIAGGYSTVVGSESDVQRLPILSQAQSAHYERTIDVGVVANSIDYIRYNGSAKCGAQLQYATADGSGIFGAYTTAMYDAVAGTTYNINSLTNKRYVRVIVTLNDQVCGVTTTVTDVTVGYSVLAPPVAPTLSAPASGATSVSVTPLFQLKTTHSTSTYAQYKILIYQSDCSTLVRTIDQTASQTGWGGQDAQTATAYVMGVALGASTMASHTYQAAALSNSTTYCWKGAAINPAGSSIFGSYSAAQLFTTFTPQTSPATPTLTRPAAGQTGVSITPEFRLFATDPNSDYVNYKILLYQSDCATLVRTIDQTTSQTGWLGQSQQTATAYSSGQMAIHDYQLAALSINTTYCWKAAAIDPAGTNLFGSYSTTNLFTTQITATTNNILLNGNIIINGSVKIHP